MIASFGDRATEDLYHGRPTSRVRRFPPGVEGQNVHRVRLTDYH